MSAAKRDISPSALSQRPGKTRLTRSVTLVPSQAVKYVYRVMRGDGRDLEEPNRQWTQTKRFQHVRISEALEKMIKLPELAAANLPLRFRQEVLYAIQFGSQPDYMSPFLHATKSLQTLARWHSRARERDPKCYMVRIDTSKFKVVHDPEDDGHLYGSQPGLLDMSSEMKQKTLQHVNSHIPE